jgi:hypothetical protein
MLKLGICTVRQSSLPYRLWHQGPISARLLSDASDIQFDQIMRHVCLSNGTARTTAPNRFSELHVQISPWLSQHFSPDTPLSVQDWAVSSGVTAAAWYRHLSLSYPNLHFAASDWMLNLIEVHHPQEGYTFIAESDLTPIQYVKPPFVIQLIRPVHPLFPVNRSLRHRALLLWRDQVRPKITVPDNLDPFGEAIASSGPYQIRNLSLLRPDVRALRSDRFRLHQHSVFSPAQSPVHIIRTMNILNKAYFDETQLRQAAQSVAASLLPGGLWIVGRTTQEDPPTHEVSVFENTPKGWRLLHRIGPGSEIEPFIQFSE